MKDEDYMAAALRLAKKGAGKTSPNPQVGAVIVKGDRVIGQGYHHRAGGDHAEAAALKNASEDPRDATLYVTLEPCCTHGRTPPCTDALLGYGLSRVVVGMVDPNPRVSGRGMEILRKGGVEIRVGVLEEACRNLNEAYIKHVTTGLPFVIMKSAATLDGKIAAASGESRWITGEEARKFVHTIRSRVDAVMTGVGTILRDDPQLTARPNRGSGRNPTRIIVDSRLRTPPTARVLHPGTGAEVFIATLSGAPSEKAEALRARGAHILAVPPHDGRVDLADLMRQFGERGITSILMEGGSELNAGALAQGVVDKVLIFFAPMIMGGWDSPPIVGGRGPLNIQKAGRLTRVSMRKLGRDRLLTGYMDRRCSQD